MNKNMYTVKKISTYELYKKFLDIQLDILWDGGEQVNDLASFAKSMLFQSYANDIDYIVNIRKLFAEGYTMTLIPQFDVEIEAANNGGTPFQLQVFEDQACTKYLCTIDGKDMDY